MYERSRQDISEISRKQYWLIDFEFTRLAISQETPNKDSKLIVNGKMWKKMCGGGDTIVARRNYDRVDTYFNIDTTFMVMGNDPLRFDTADVYEHGVQFASTVKFRTQEEIDYVKEHAIDPLEYSNLQVSDPEVKNKCASLEWKLAMIQILLENYNKASVPIEIDNDDSEEVSLRRQILEMFEVTNNNEDFILVDYVVNDLNQTRKKVTEEMKDLGIDKKRSKLTTHRDKVCFYGLKKRVVEEKKESNEE
jgi:hypothetical protein